MLSLVRNSNKINLLNLNILPKPQFNLRKNNLQLSLKIYNNKNMLSTSKSNTEQNTEQNEST